MSSTFPRLKSIALGLMLAICLSWIGQSLFAQTTPVAATPASVAQEEAITLSPFTVTSDKDTGYAATNTLAGTRLNTPVKDLGASISIYTKDFLDDIGATNANEFLVYATGMEAAGPGGNFSGAAASISADQVVGDSQRVNPQAATRTRGLGSPNFSRGLFATDIAGDSYNTETATVIRGPNAILFGAGSPAGVVDTGLIRPNLNRNTNKLESRFGSNSSLRGNFDFNRVLIRGQLALRLAALDDREEYNQRPAFHEKRRLFGALTFEPFKATSLRANFETGTFPLASRRTKRSGSLVEGRFWSSTTMASGVVSLQKKVHRSLLCALSPRYSKHFHNSSANSRWPRSWDD